MKILITGTAGFIGFHLVQKLVNNNDTQIIGLDNINDYYDVNLKYARLKETGIEKENISEKLKVKSKKYHNYSFIKLDLINYKDIVELFKNERFDYIFHLAAQAGIRYSLKDPHAYIDSNITGFLNILEGIRNYPVKHLFFASSSSVYGANKEIPFSEDDVIDKPVSLYAATKKANELMAHSYSHLFNIPVTGLRFFTVYGPWGRPDMAYYSFAKAIIEEKPINVFNGGKMFRDFTYIEDAINAIKGLYDYVLTKADLKTEIIKTHYNIYNIGHNNPVELTKFINILEDATGKKAMLNPLPMQPGDMEKTYANIDKLISLINFEPKTPLSKGINNFVEWYKSFHII